MSIIATGTAVVSKIESFERSNFSGWDVNLRCTTGEKKKEGQQYAPRHRIKITLSESQGKYVTETLEIGVNDSVQFTGELVSSYLFQDEESGDFGEILQIRNGNLSKVYTEGGKKEDAAPASAPASKKSAAKAKVAESDDDIEF